MSGEMVAWCCCWWQHGGCEGGAAAAVTVDGGDGDDRDGVAVTCGGVKAAGDDGVEGVVVRGDGIGGVVLSGGDGDDMMGDGVDVAVVVLAVAVGGDGGVGIGGSDGVMMIIMGVRWRWCYGGGDRVARGGECAGFERGLSMHQTKDEFAAVLKKMADFMPGAQDRLAEASPLVAQTDYAFLNKISQHATEPLLDSTVTPVYKSLELSTNVNFTASAVASEHNEEMVNAEVHGSDPKMTDDTTTVKSGHAFVQGNFVALDDVMELVEVGSGRVSSGSNDVVVALSAYEKGDGLDPSSAAGEPSGV
ncbi:hypothetical protein Tco_0210003 [Tanacetum coccineum]